jgi:hypothetical protein
MSKEFDALFLAGGARYDITLINGTVRSGLLPPGTYKLINGATACFVGVKPIKDAGSSITVANGLPFAVNAVEYVNVPQDEFGYELQAAAAAGGTLKIFGPC